MSSQDNQLVKGREPFWKFVLPWVVGTFVGVSITHGFPPNRERLTSWAEFVAAGVVTGAFVRLADPWLRRFKIYRSLEMKLGLNRNAGA